MPCLLVIKMLEALGTTPPTMSQAEASEVEITAANLLGRVIATLDLSPVPEALRQHVGVETALQPLDAVPHAHMVAAVREQDAGPVHWRYPNSAIEAERNPRPDAAAIVEIPEGERQGQFLCSGDSVNRIPNYYEEVRGLPYRRDDYGTLALQCLSPGNFEGAHEA